MRIEMSLERFIEINRLATLGNLIHGVVHNLNGPLQNLGMDMEMMEHSIKADKRVPEDMSAGILNRLHRMEGEFDHINNLIRSSTMRIDVEEDYLQCGTFRGLLEQEISFLNANLYFKHNVQKDIRVEEDLPPLRRFPENILLSLSWLIQSIVEEMERSTAKALTLKGRSLGSAIEISFTIEGEMDPKFMSELGNDFSSSPCIQADDAPGLKVALSILRLHDASIVCRPLPTGFSLLLNIPCSSNPGAPHE